MRHEQATHREHLLVLEELNRDAAMIIDKAKAAAISAGASAQDAADFAQEAYRKALEKHDQYERKNATLSTWVATIAKRLAIDAYRKSIRHRELLEQKVIPTQSEKRSFDEIIDDVDTLEKALKILTSEKRETVKLHLQGKTKEDIAAILKIPPGTVISRINRAKNEMIAWAQSQRDSADAKS